MLLERLRQYADRLDLSPPMYQKTAIRWLIDIDREGSLVGPGFTATTSGKPGKRDRGKEYIAPFIGRSSGVRPKLLADTGEYVFGIARDPQKQERVDACHRAFVQQVQHCAAAIEEPSVIAVLLFLQNMTPDALPLPEDFDTGQTVSFRVDGQLPIELPAVQAYWASVTGEATDPESVGQDMQCLICGQRRPPVKRLPFKIKRIPGGQTSGTALISANAPAFESYGLKASLISPTCQECGERFSKATNALIEGEDTHIRVGPLVYLFWTKDEMPFAVRSLLSKPEPEDVLELIRSAFRGRGGAVHIDPAPFYATALSASGGRVVVRDWLETTVGHARHQLARYFALQALVDRDGGVGAPYGLYTLAAATVRDANKDLSSNTPQALLHMALNGGALPLWLLFQAVQRNRAEQGVTRNRAALIKMVLLSQQETLTKEDTMEQLDADNHDPAYLCGRLLAVLEAVQRAALPGINATITDRFFGTASSAPASVFGRLIRGSQAHLGKLRKGRRGTYEALQRRLEEVQAGLETFPKTLTLKDQGLFGLGYYHQRAADRAAAIAHRQSREDATPDADDTPDHE